MTKKDLLTNLELSKFVGLSCEICDHVFISPGDVMRRDAIMLYWGEDGIPHIACKDCFQRYCNQIPFRLWCIKMSKKPFRFSSAKEVSFGICSHCMQKSPKVRNWRLRSDKIGEIEWFFCPVCANIFIETMEREWGVKECSSCGVWTPVTKLRKIAGLYLCEWCMATDDDDEEEF